MRVVENNAARLVLRDRTYWISAICLTAAAILLAQSILGAGGAVQLVPAAVAALFGLAFLRASNVVFDKAARAVHIRRLDVLRVRRRDLKFGEIGEVRLEMQRSNDPDALTYRLSLSAGSATFPLSAAFEPGSERHEAIRGEILNALGRHAEPPTTAGQVERLVKEGRIIDAVAILRMRDGLTLTDARSRVGAVQASLAPDPNDSSRT